MSLSLFTSHPLFFLTSGELPLYFVQFQSYPSVRSLSMYFRCKPLPIFYKTIIIQDSRSSESNFPSSSVSSYHPPIWSHLGIVSFFDRLLSMYSPLHFSRSTVSSFGTRRGSEGGTGCVLVVKSLLVPV